MPRPCNHDFESADGGGQSAGEPILMSPSDDLVPAAIWQGFAPPRDVVKSEGHAEGARHWPVGCGRIDGNQPVFEIAFKMAVAVIKCRCRVVAHERGHR